jgi:hypothetical protein
MITIRIATSDGVVWNESQVQHEIISAMSKNADLLLDFISEGPDIQSLCLYQFLSDTAKIFNYNLSKVQIHTANALEDHNVMLVKYSPPIHLIQNAKDYLITINKKKNLKHFGLFVGRSNAPRLSLASYIIKYYKNKSLCSYHFNTNDDFHKSNIGIEDLLTKYNKQNLIMGAEFLQQCPILLESTQSVTIDKSLSLNPAQQLLKKDSAIFCQAYQDFFVEIVCESYFTGNTFFVTEKTWRPMLLKTPFIVQGPRNFLHNLRKIGFQTFDQWWDEGYAEDPADHQITEIKKLLDWLAQKTTSELNSMYSSMHDVLEHNYQLIMKLTKQDFLKLHVKK